MLMMISSNIEGVEESGSGGLRILSMSNCKYNTVDCWSNAFLCIAESSYLSYI